jgi:EAL domain-containing protein (putative c-di-GMP-specific phosphodiesterase class I)
LWGSFANLSEFVQHLGINAEDTSLVRTIIALGLDLGMNVVAEGVETEMQLQLLLGCDVAQGYLLARPVLFEDALLALEQRPSG